MNPGLLQLIERAPAALGRFEGTELSLPVSRALFGKELELPALLEAAHGRFEGDVKDAPGSGPGQALAVALVLAEAIESAQEDRQDFFVSDFVCRNQVVSRVTKGRVKRVFLHSLRDYPHTNCGCFENIAFYLEAGQ